MGRTAISQAAFEAIAKTLPLGSVGYENKVNEKGKRLIWLAAPRSDVTNDPNICTRCIGAERFAKWIGRHGVVGQCGIEPAHGRRRKVVPVSISGEN
jgi:hypothetical protein